MKRGREKDWERKGGVGGGERLFLEGLRGGGLGRTNKKG